MTTTMPDDPIVLELNGLPLAKSEDEVRTLLRRYHAKQLRSACVKLRLGAQKRSSTQDNKAGYVNLLWGHYEAKCRGVIGALEGPNVVLREGSHEPRVTRHCRFRLLNVIFSDTFINRTTALAINGNAPYWEDVTKAYNEDLGHYNRSASDRNAPLYHGIDAGMASQHSREKLQAMWKDTMVHYDTACSLLKRPGSSGRLWDYCGGRADALYLDDWLEIRPDRRETVTGLITSMKEDKRAPVPLARDERGERPAKRLRSLAPAERMKEVVEEGREEEEKEERQHEKEAAHNGQKSCAAVVRLSTAVQSAMTTLNMLKASHSSQHLVENAEQLVNAMVVRWMEAMKKAQ